MNIWIVVPAFNEAAVLGPVLGALRKRCPNVVVVDDASNDETDQVAVRQGVSVVTHLINRGQGAALKTGIDYALSQGAEAIVTFDADGQHRVEDIDALLQPLLLGSYDVSLGSRFLGNAFAIPPFRRIILRLAVVFTRIFSRVHVTDTHNGLRAFTRAAALKIRISQDRMEHASEILDEITIHHLRYREVPVTIAYTAHSRRKGQGNSALFKIAAKYLFHRISRL